MFRIGELFIPALLWLKNFASPFLIGAAVAAYCWYGIEAPTGKALAALALMAGTATGVLLAEYLRKNSPGAPEDSEQAP